MHEVSLVRNVFKTLEEEFPPEDMARLRTIRMTVGELSNVQPILMQNAFSAVKEDNPRYADVSLEIDQIPVKIECTECGKVSEVQGYRFICACGKPCNNVISGTELLIHQVEFLD